MKKAFIYINFGAPAIAEKGFTGCNGFVGYAHGAPCLFRGGILVSEHKGVYYQGDTTCPMYTEKLNWRLPRKGKYSFPQWRDYAEAKLDAAETLRAYWDFCNSVRNQAEGGALFQWIMSGRTYSWSSDLITNEMKRGEAFWGWHFMGSEALNGRTGVKGQPLLASFIPSKVKAAFDFFQVDPSEDINVIKKKYLGLVRRWHPGRSLI